MQNSGHERKWWRRLLHHGLPLLLHDRLLLENHAWQTLLVGLLLLFLRHAWRGLLVGLLLESSAATSAPRRAKTAGGPAAPPRRARPAGVFIAAVAAVASESRRARPAGGRVSKVQEQSSMASGEETSENKCGRVAGTTGRPRQH